MRALAAVAFVLPLLASTACGSHGGGDDEPDVYTSVEVEPPLATVTVALGTTGSQSFTVYGIALGYPRKDITARCQLTVDAVFGQFTAATMTVQPHGGKTPVLATCEGVSGQAQLAVNLAGSVTVGTGVPANAAELFTNATAGTDTARIPVIEYPLDKAVSPRNIPPVETQWTAAGNDLFHVRLASSFLAIDVYSATREAQLPAADWEKITQTAAGDTLSFVVEGLSQAAPAEKFTSTQATVTMSQDNIDQTAIYYWASSQGNVMSQVFGTTAAPSVVKGNCTSCHSVSRSGTRIGYSRCVGGTCGSSLRVGFLKFDSVTQTWVDTYNADTSPLNGSFTTFAPVGNPFPDDTKAVAMVGLANGTMGLYDPDNGAPVASNLSVANFGATRSALMPDWSPDGNSVVFTSTASGNTWIDLDGGRIAKMSYQYTGGVHTFGAPEYLVPASITRTNGTFSNFFFPSFSPDNKLVVFNAARSGWRNTTDAKFPGQRLMLTNAMGDWVQDLTALNGGDVDSDITWAHWAPNISNDYYWVVFSSQRDYGHRATLATTPAACKNAGVAQCKQIWLGAIARNKLTGALDPSAPPMWLPGQDPQVDNISPFWSRPAQIQ